MKLSEWRDGEVVTEQLIQRGMSRACAEHAAPCFANAASALSDDLDIATDAIGCWAPGRIEVLGKHTDYCGGESIVGAVERGFCMLAVPRDESVVRLLDARAGEASEFPFDVSIRTQVGHGTNYPQTVVRRLARNFPNRRRGATMAFASNLPSSSGLSSSSAFIVGTFLLLAEVNQLRRDPAFSLVIQSTKDLASYLSTIENGMSFGPLVGDVGVGTLGGSEDHTAILCSAPGRLVQFRYCPVRFCRSITVANEYELAIASSGVVAEKTGAALVKYNRLSLLARAIVEVWRSNGDREVLPLADIILSAPGAADELRNSLRKSQQMEYTAEELVERLDHFLCESKLIAAVPGSIDATTIDQFGKLVDDSHAAGTRLLKNQTPETLHLVGIAKDLGAHAASAFGAGFGGSVWALVDTPQSASIVSEWSARYLREFPQQAERCAFFSSQLGPAAFTVK